MKKVLWISLIVWIFSFTFAQPLFHFSTHVVKMYDGDTVRVQQNLSWNIVDTKIRTLWMDAPELYHTWMVVKDYKFYWCWKKSKDIAAKFLLNKTVKVYSDTLAKNKWKYGRLLRYIYVPLPYKGKTIYLPYGAIMVYLGYAKVYEYEKFTYKKLYEKLQNMAKKAHRWMWSAKCIQEDKQIKAAYKRYLEEKRRNELEKQKKQFSESLFGELWLQVNDNSKTTTTEKKATTETTTEKETPKTNNTSYTNLNLTCPTHRVYCSHLTTCAEAKYLIETETEHLVKVYVEVNKNFIFLDKFKMIFGLIIIIWIMFWIAKLINNDNNIYNKLCKKDFKNPSKWLWTILIVYIILILWTFIMWYKTGNGYYSITGFTFLLISIIFLFYCQKEKNSIFWIITTLITIILIITLKQIWTNLIKYLNTHEQLIELLMIVIILLIMISLFLIYRASEIISKEKKSEPKNITIDYLNYLMSRFLSISSVIIIVLIIVIYNKKINTLSDSFDTLYQKIIINIFKEAMLIYLIAMVIMVSYSIYIIRFKKPSLKDINK